MLLHVCMCEMLFKKSFYSFLIRELGEGVLGRGLPCLVLSSSPGEPPARVRGERRGVDGRVFLSLK